LKNKDFYIIFYCLSFYFFKKAGPRERKKMIKSKPDGYFSMFINFKIPALLIFITIFIILGLTAHPVSGKTSSMEKTILGQPFYLLAEKELVYSDLSFRQFWETCLSCLHKLEFRLKATTYLDNEHIILALTKTRINRFRFISQDNRSSRAPDLGWLNEGLLYLQIHISEETYGLATRFKLGTDRSSNQNRTSVFKAERSLIEFINTLNRSLESLKGRTI
jgi:hypothetical protein